MSGEVPVDGVISVAAVSFAEKEVVDKYAENLVFSIGTHEFPAGVVEHVGGSSRPAHHVVLSDGGAFFGVDDRGVLIIVTVVSRLEIAPRQIAVPCDKSTLGA